MALIVGHSQVKYLHEYLTDDRVFTLSFSGYKVLDIFNECSVFDAIRDVSVSHTFFVY